MASNSILLQYVNFIFGFVLALYTQYFPKLCEKKRTWGKYQLYQLSDTHWCKGKTKIYILYPRCKFNIYYSTHVLLLDLTLVPFFFLFSFF